MTMSKHPLLSVAALAIAGAVLGAPAAFASGQMRAPTSNYVLRSNAHDDNIARYFAPSSLAMRASDGVDDPFYSIDQE